MIKVSVQIFFTVKYNIDPKYYSITKTKKGASAFRSIYSIMETQEFNKCFLFSFAKEILIMK